MYKISIVIVNYNVKYFIRQCLQSVYKSKLNAEIEVIVVDNNSIDGSIEMIQQEFPNVQLISNQNNVGFSKANNQGFAKASGDYVLVLNPDTIIEETTLQICLDYCVKNQDVGAIGVKMLDGAGNFLPESKRGFPTPFRSVTKLLGISKLFKSSPTFNGYYLGHLSTEEINTVEVLTGAFMFIPKDVLISVGGFDEDYFMYGEDIELSFQIQKQGKKIVYLPTSSIIHFKGESTKKSSIQYLKNFYGAMAIYAQKRHRGSGWMWNVILKFGILITALVSTFKNVLQNILRPLLDIFILFGITKLIQVIWAFLYFKNESYYADPAILFSTLFSITGLLSIYYLLGHYDKKYQFSQLAFSFVFSALLVLSIYAIYPLDWRYSRIVLIALILLAPLILFITRCFYHKLIYGFWSFRIDNKKRIAIIGSENSFSQISDIAHDLDSSTNIIGRISENIEHNQLGELLDIKSIIASRGLNELIFCTKDITTEKIFTTIADLQNEIAFKIASDDNSTILGSDSKDRLGEWFTLNINFKVTQKVHQRTKRLIDLFVVFILIIFCPIVLVFLKQRTIVYSNILNVAFNIKSWIGFDSTDEKLTSLPQIPYGVFAYNGWHQKRENSEIHQDNLYYARNYTIWIELEQIFKNLFSKR